MGGGEMAGVCACGGKIIVTPARVGVIVCVRVTDKARGPEFERPGYWSAALAGLPASLPASLPPCLRPCFLPPCLPASFLPASRPPGL